MRLTKSLLIPLLAFFVNLASAQTQIPFNGSTNSVEYKQAGNTYTWSPVTGETPRPAQPYRPDLSGGAASTVEPKAKWTPRLPYEHKGGSAAKTSVEWPVDPKKAAKAASDAAAAGAAGLAGTGNPYVAGAAIACAFVCAPLMDALLNWGVEQFMKNDDGSLSAMVPDPENPQQYSDGNRYKAVSILPWALTKEQACQDLKAHQATSLVYVVDGDYCVRQGNVRYKFEVSVNSPCVAGSPVSSGVCGQVSPGIATPLETYLDSNYTGKGWNHHWAGITAGLIASGANVFTDGTGSTITGPAVVPVSTTESKTPVNVHPGTTTPVPSGHTGPAESGTQTTTTTTTAKNTYSNGSPGTGPSMTTTTQTTTITNITNNVSNITSTVNQTTTEKDEAPEEAPTDTPFADLPDLYEQKYPDGLIGVLRTQTAAIKATPLFQLPMQLMGDLPETGQCPSWQLDLSIASWASYGSYDIGADCAIWDFAGWVVLISAFLLARQLIFGG